MPASPGISLPDEQGPSCPRAGTEICLGQALLAISSPSSLQSAGSQTGPDPASFQLFQLCCLAPFGLDLEAPAGHQESIPLAALLTPLHYLCLGLHLSTHFSSTSSFSSCNNARDVHAIAIPSPNRSLKGILTGSSLETQGLPCTWPV